MAYGSDVWKWPLDANGSSNDFEYFFWVPWLLPHVGALVGAAGYLVFVSIHHESGDVKQEMAS